MRPVVVEALTGFGIAGFKVRRCRVRELDACRSERGGFVCRYCVLLTGSRADASVIVTVRQLIARRVASHWVATGGVAEGLARWGSEAKAKSGRQGRRGERTRRGLRTLGEVRVQVMPWHSLGGRCGTRRGRPRRLLFGLDGRKVVNRNIHPPTRVCRCGRGCAF